jgi:predicted dehydrogenase
VLSTAAIGRVVAMAARQGRHAVIAAVASRDGDRARQFADELGIPTSFGSYEELLASDVDAVYVPLPVALHTTWTVAALEAGKHVLCEKPFAMTADDAARCFDAATTADRVVAEALMYRHHPQTALVQRLLADGAIGELSHVRAALTVSVEPGDIRRSAELGGGALLDLGCYCVSAIRLFAGEPRRVYAERIDDGDSVDAVDLRLTATMRTVRGVLALFDVALDLCRRDELELVGTGGRIIVDDPWLCRSGWIDLVDASGRHRLPVDPEDTWGLAGAPYDGYRIHLDTLSRAIVDGFPTAFGRDDAVAQARALEAVRSASVAGAPVDVETTESTA